MAKNQSSSSRRSSRSRKSNSALEQEKEERHKNRHSTLTIELHVNHTKNKSTNSNTKLDNRPFTHPSLQSISLKTKWTAIKKKITDVIQTSEFQSKFKNTKYDEDNGVIGWTGKRKEEENPKSILKGKAIMEIDSDDSWKFHYKRV